MELPVLGRPIDNTALGTYMACPREFLFAMVLNRRKKKGARDSPALEFGSLWHKILELHYQSGGDIATVMQAIDFWKGNPPDDYRTFQRAMMDYRGKWQKTWDPEKDLRETVGFPDSPMVEIRAEIEAEELVHPYAGKIDRVFVEHEGQAFVEDHKTTSRLDKHYFKQFELSNQMMGYTFMGQRLAPSLGIAGVRINLYHCLTKQSNFHRRVIMFSKAQLRAWAENYNSWMGRLRMDYWSWYIQQGNDPDELGIDPGIVDLLRNWTPMPAHFGDNGCSRKFGLCTYYGVCSLTPRVQMKVLEADFDIAPWNPLEVDEAA